MVTKKICNHLSIHYQHSTASTLFLVSFFEWQTGCYVSSMMSNNKESLIKQISEYARLNEQEEILMRKIIS